MPYQKVGSLWIRDTKDGKKKYLSGVIKIDGVETKISVWKNDKGDNPKRPDYVIQAQIEELPPPPSSDADEDADDIIRF
jgi:uncharacterized protein (DUF736 family)